MVHYVPNVSAQPFFPSYKILLIMSAGVGVCEGALYLLPINSTSNHHTWLAGEPCALGDAALLGNGDLCQVAPAVV